MYHSLALCALLLSTAWSAPVNPVRKDELAARQGDGNNPFNSLFWPLGFPTPTGFPTPAGFPLPTGFPTQTGFPLATGFSFPTGFPIPTIPTPGANNDPAFRFWGFENAPNPTSAVTQPNPETSTELARPQDRFSLSSILDQLFSNLNKDQGKKNGDKKGNNQGATPTQAIQTLTAPTPQSTKTLAETLPEISSPFLESTMSSRQENEDDKVPGLPGGPFPSKPAVPSKSGEPNFEFPFPVAFPGQDQVDKQDKDSEDDN